MDTLNAIPLKKVNEDKYLIFASTDKNKEVVENQLNIIYIL